MMLVDSGILQLACISLLFLRFNRWFALFRDKATGAKRAKTFTARMYDGCVFKAYEACALQFIDEALTAR